MRRALVLVTAVALLTAGAGLGLVSMTFPVWVWTLVLAATAGNLLVVSVAWLWRDASLPCWWLPLLVGVGIAVRVLVMPAQYLLSDDAARYHWDGKVLAHGINPYLHTPDSPALAHLRTDALDERINHPDVVTVYPPLAQVLFAVAYWLSPGRLIGFQGLCLAAELCCWLLLAWHLRRRGGAAAWLLLAIWSPLLIVEGYAPGHSDLLGLPLLALFLIATLRRWPARAGLALAAACLIKPLMLLLAPAAFRELGRHAAPRFALAATVTVVVLYLPFAEAGSALFSSMGLMAREWSFNATVAAGVEALLPPFVARINLGLLLAAAVAAGAWWGSDFLSRCLLALAALVVFSPVVFPWYLVWLLPLLVLRPDPALLALLALVPLTELVVIPYTESGVWAEPQWPRLVVFGPFYALLVVGWRRGWGMFARPGEAV